MAKNAVDLPEAIHIPVTHDGLPTLISDLSDLDVNGVVVTGVNDEGTRTYIVQLDKGQVFSLINKHALDLVVGKYT